MRRSIQQSEPPRFSAFELPLRRWPHWDTKWTYTGDATAARLRGDGRALRAKDRGRPSGTGPRQNRLTKMVSKSGNPVHPKRLEFDYVYLHRRIEKRVYDATSGGSLEWQRRFIHEGHNLIAGVRRDLLLFPEAGNRKFCILQNLKE